jgi:hypothetical protein
VTVCVGCYCSKDPNVRTLRPVTSHTNGHNIVLIPFPEDGASDVPKHVGVR